ncbi:MAG: SCO family protein [Flavisolibacter sp.]|jgi:protein SCO1/2
MSRKRLFYLIFFLILVFGFFAALAIVMPGYLKPKSPPVSVVQPFSLTNQDGNNVTDSITRGKVHVVNFFFTTCRSVCPRMNNNLKVIYDEFAKNPDFIMLSFTSDPERDTPVQLKHYADSIKVDTHKWQFITGRKDSLYSLARNSYKIDDPKNFVTRIEDDFLHTQFIALVNRQGEVVGIYDGLKPSELREMSAKIRKLLNESL